MFKFLKEKLKGAISKFSKSVEEGAKEKAEAPIKEEYSIGANEVENLITEAGKNIAPEEPKAIILEPEIKQAESEVLPEPSDFEEQKEIIESENDVKEIIGGAEKSREDTIIKNQFQEKMPQKEAKEYLKEESYKEGAKVYDQTDIRKHAYEEKIEKKGFFAKLKEKIITTKISEEKFEDLFSSLEMALLENNVAMEVIEKIKNDLKNNLVDTPIKRMKIEDTVTDSLRNSINDLFNIEKIELIEKIKGKAEKPVVIAFFGINGSGKTTTIAKIAEMLKNKKISCVLAAADTFRAASIEQIQLHADRIGVKVIKHDYGSDPAAVAFDAIKHAKAKNIDAVLIDTAGRLHNNKNLMDELKKVVRVAKPDLKIFVGESIAGNDCIEQVQKYDEMIGIDCIILTKADVDEKGGTAISVSYVTKKPIIYLGVGQEYKDLREFEPEIIVESLGL